MAAGLLTACGSSQVRTSPSYGTEEARRSLGRIAYATGAYEPVPATHFRARNKLHGAGQGFFDGLEDCLSGLSNEPEFGAILIVIVSPVCVLVGTLAGAAEAPPGHVVRAADGALRRDMRGLGANASLRAALAAHLASAGLEMKPLPLGQGPQDAHHMLVYGDGVRADADTVLELRVVDWQLVSQGKDPVAVREVHLVLVAQVRVVATAPAREVLDEFTYTHRGAAFILDAAGPNGAQRLERELAGAQQAVIHALAERWPEVLSPEGSTQVASEHLGEAGHQRLGLVLGGAAEARVEGLQRDVGAAPDARVGDAEQRFGHEGALPLQERGEVAAVARLRPHVQRLERSDHIR